MKRSITGVVLLVVMAIPGVHAQTTSDLAPQEVLVQFSAAFNSGDFEAAAGFFAEDVVVTFVPAFFQAPIVSRQELLNVFGDLRETEPQMTIVVQQVLGDDLVIANTLQWDEGLRAMGIEAFEFTEVYLVRGGLIHGATSLMTSDSLLLAIEVMEAMTTE